MSKFDELKKAAEAATEIIGKTHPEIEAATAAFKQIVTPGAVDELLAIQAQLVEALKVAKKSMAHVGQDSDRIDWDEALYKPMDIVDAALREAQP